VQLEIDHSGQLILRVPKRISEHEIERVLNRRAEWIAKARQKVASRGVVITHQFEEGEKFLYLGQEYLLQFHDEYFHGVKFDNDKILVSKSYQLKAKSLLTKWYKAEALTYFKIRLDYYANIMGVKYADAKLSKAARRWGSCSHNGNINLNWKLIMASPEIIDYVIVHELSHIPHPNHSRTFWLAVEKIMPDYRTNRKWLKDNGYKLTI